MMHTVLLLALAMPSGSFQTLRDQVESESFSKDQLAAISTAARSNTFTTAQVVGLLEELSFSKDQLSALRALAPRMEGRVDTETIVDVFSFSSDQDKARAILSSATPAAAPAPRAAPTPRAAPSRPAPPRAAAAATPATSTAGAHCPDRADLPALTVQYAGTWRSADVDALVKRLEDTGFSSDRLDVLRSALDGAPRGLGASQVKRILATFGFNSDMATAVELMDDHILGLTAAEMKGVLGEFGFAKDRLQALTALRDTMTDPEHAHVLLDAFDMSSDKAKARAILDDIRPRSHLFGTVGAGSAVFVVDASGSMGAKVRTNQGTSLTRLEFVQCQLARVLDDQLAPSAQFGIVVFADGSRQLGDGLLSATPGNL